MIGLKLDFSNIVERLETSIIRKILDIIGSKNLISFAGGLPDPNLLPKEELVNIIRDIVECCLDAAIQYAPTKGVEPFIEAVREFSRRLGIRLREFDDIMGVCGSQEGISLVAMALLKPGEVVVTEEPTFLAALQIFRAFGAKIVGVPVDQYGVDTQRLEEIIKRYRPKLVYLNPTFHNPTGTCLTLDRRKHLVEIAEKYDVFIIEDDPYRLLYFESPPPPPLKAFDEQGHVIYVGSFSKILSPGLRVGFVVANKDLMDALLRLKQAINLQTPTLSQYIIAFALNKGVVERNLPRMREGYRAKRDAMLEAIEEYITGIKYTKPEGGFYIWVELGKEIDTMSMLKVALSKGVAYVPGRPFYPEKPRLNTMRLSYSLPSESEIREGIRRLALVLREYGL